MAVSVQVTQEVARVLQKQSDPTPASEELLTILQEMEIKLKPTHPGTKDPDLSTYFTVELEDTATAEKVRDRLLLFKAVKGAFIKPPDEPAE